MVSSRPAFLRPTRSSPALLPSSLSDSFTNAANPNLLLFNIFRTLSKSGSPPTSFKSEPCALFAKTQGDRREQPLFSLPRIQERRARVHEPDTSDTPVCTPSPMPSMGCARFPSHRGHIFQTEAISLLFDPASFPVSRFLCLLCFLYLGSSRYYPLSLQQCHP